jgi:hypothetical protein
MDVDNNEICYCEKNQTATWKLVRFVIFVYPRVQWIFTWYFASGRVQQDFYS